MSVVMFWMLCIWDSELLLLSRPESKHRSECLPRGSGQSYRAGEYHQESTTTISSQKSSWVENFVDTSNQFKEPLFSFSWITVVSQWRINCHEAFVTLFQAHGAQVRRHPRPQSSPCVDKPLKAKTSQFGFRRSLFWMCLRGERPGHVWHWHW